MKELYYSHNYPVDSVTFQTGLESKLEFQYGTVESEFSSGILEVFSMPTQRKEGNMYDKEKRLHRFSFQLQGDQFTKQFCIGRYFQR